MSNLSLKRLVDVMIVFVPVIMLLAVSAMCPIPVLSKVETLSSPSSVGFALWKIFPNDSSVRNDLRAKTLLVESEDATSENVSCFLNQAAEQNKDILIQNVEELLSYDPAIRNFHGDSLYGKDISEQLCDDVWLLVTKLRAGIFAAFSCTAIALCRRRFKSVAHLGVVIGVCMAVTGLLNPFDG